MTKNEIIESVVSVIVPAGARLVRRDIDALGITISDVGKDAGGAKILVVEMFVDQLKNDTSDINDTPSPALFERLHIAVLYFNDAMIDNSFIEAIEEEVCSQHRAMIERLRQIAKELNIIYAEPDDPLLP
jgi:hypothetical protein